MPIRSAVSRRVLLGVLTAIVTVAGARVVPALAGGHPGSTGPHRVWIRRGHYRIAAYEQAGTGPAIVLCHGFPDNHHLYDLVLPYLKGRHVVSFDFLGWGASDKPAGYKYTFTGQEADLNAVISQLYLGKVTIQVQIHTTCAEILSWVHSVCLACDKRHQVAYAAKTADFRR